MTSRLGDPDDDPISAAALRVGHGTFAPLPLAPQQLPPKTSTTNRPTIAAAEHGDDDPISAAACAHFGHNSSGGLPMPVMPSAATPSSRPSTSKPIASSPAATPQVASKDDPKYDTATMMLEQAIASHAATAASTGKGSKKSKQSNKPSAAVSVGTYHASASASLPNFHCILTCMELKIGQCACHAGALGCLGAGCCGCVKPPHCQLGSCCTAPVPEAVVRHH